jgi:hypothetical protein
MCELAFSTCTQVYDRILQLYGLLHKVLNSTFHILLQLIFKQVSASSKTKKEKSMNNGGVRGATKQKRSAKRRTEMATSQKNSSQPDNFKVAEGKTWRDTFLDQLPQDQPAWKDIVKMCAWWHIREDCYNNC